jgi:YVTN family beta-propeller protein
VVDVSVPRTNATATNVAPSSTTTITSTQIHVERPAPDGPVGGAPGAYGSALGAYGLAVTEGVAETAPAATGIATVGSTAGGVGSVGSAGSIRPVGSSGSQPDAAASAGGSLLIGGQPTGTGVGGAAALNSLGTMTCTATPGPWTLEGMQPVTSTSTRRARSGAAPTRLVAAAVALGLLAGACANTDPQVSAGDTAPNGRPAADSTADPTADPTVDPANGAASAPTRPPVDVLPGMPPVVDPANLYSETRSSNVSPATEGHRHLVYVPNERSGNVTVIDPATFEVIDTFPTGFIPQHVVPSYDLETLYVLNNNGNSITPLDPRTGKPGKTFPVHDPYNLYFTPDGKSSIIVAEAEQRLDFADPKTMDVTEQLQTECDGINHVDFSMDGKSLAATCEFEGAIIKVDVVNRKVVGKIRLEKDGQESQPQDIRITPDGKTFYVADLKSEGVFTVDVDSFTETGHVRTGIGAHGLYPSRDGTKLYVINRGTPLVGGPPNGRGSVSVLDFDTGTVEANWPVPEGGSPDMGNLSADGTQLWLGGRYDDEVYVFDTVKGEMITRIPVGKGPHGLTVWPQPGRYSLGHTGNMR